MYASSGVILTFFTCEYKVGEIERYEENKESSMPRFLQSKDVEANILQHQLRSHMLAASNNHPAYLRRVQLV